MRVKLNTFVLGLTLVDITVAQKRLGSSSKERTKLSRKTQHSLRGFKNDKDGGDRIAWEFEQDDVFLDIATATPTISHRPTLSPAPTDRPTISAEPSTTPSLTPTLFPTSSPSYHPSISPSSLPSSQPSLKPTSTPSKKPSLTPSVGPSLFPTISPSSLPTLRPTSIPSDTPTLSPSNYPSTYPSLVPSLEPSFSPSDAPSTHPSVTPSLLPSQAPSLIPSSIPSIPPTDKPSTKPSDNPSKQPSQTPSLSPTASKAPSTVPTLSMEPTLVISVTPISMFRIVLTTPPDSPPIDPKTVVDLTEKFLDTYLEEHLESYTKYRGVDLNMVGSNRRKLQTITTIPCTGEVRFNLFASPDSDKINDLVKRAFMESKTVFFESLKQSESAGLQSLLDVKTNDTSVTTGFSMLHVSLIVISISIVIVGVFSSYLWKRTQESNVRKRLLRAAEHTRQYKGQPQLDDDCFKDIEPEPIKISDDNKALERMVMRARHDRGVMNRANEQLMEQAEVSGDMDYETNKEIRFARDLDEVLDEDFVRKRKEKIFEEGHIESISFDDDISSVVSQLSKGGSIATDPSNLVNLGYNDIEIAGRKGISAQSQDNSSTQQNSLSQTGESSSTDMFSASTRADRVDLTSTNSTEESTLRGDAISLLSHSESIENGDGEVSSSDLNHIQSGVTKDSTGNSYCTSLFSKY